MSDLAVAPEANAPPVVEEFPEVPESEVFKPSNEPQVDTEEFANYDPNAETEDAETEDEDEGATDVRAEAPETKPAADADEAAKAAEVASKAQALDNFTAELRANPAKAIQDLMTMLGTTPEAFAQAVSGKQPQSEPEPEWALEDCNPPERVAWENREFLRNGQTYVQNLAQQNNQTRALAEYNAATLEAKIDAILELSGAQLPTLDKATNDAIIALTQKGKSVRDAVMEVYGAKAKAAIVQHKQAAKPAPKTPGNKAPGAPPAVKPGASLREIWEAAGRPKF